jgi:hypothetical protein
MDDGLRGFGEMPGYEFDLPRATGQPRPGAGGGERRRQTWPQPAGQPPRQRPPGQWRQAPPEPGPAAGTGVPAAGTGRSALLARDTLAAMRARNWLTSLAAPLLAAIAVGVAGVVVLGANNGRDSAAPSSLAAGFPPARSAAADFGGDGPAVEVSAIAAAGATEVAAGSANGGGALWASADGGSTWRRAALTSPAAGRDGAGQFAGVAHGASGWLAVGGASARAGDALLPAVVGSPDGQTWTAVGGGAAFAGPGRMVTAAVAAGRSGYVIVGKASAGSRTVAAAWYAPGLRGWRRADGTRPGALDGPGNRAMNAVSATGRGFVAVGAVGARPAAWLSGTGRSWTLQTLALPAGAVSAAFDYVAANGAVVAAVGTEVTATGQRRPFAAVSTDAGAAWTPAALPLPVGGGPAAAATALTAAGGGFTATGVYGPPGETDVVVWTLAAGAAAGTAWTEVAPAGTGLAGPGMQAITALTATGATLTGVGFVSAPTSAATAMRTEPTIWQSPVRS